MFLSRARQWISRQNRFVVIGAGAAMALLGMAAAMGFKAIPRRYNVWSIAMYEGGTPFELERLTKSVLLTADDVTDVPARFVADPFMIEHEGRWYMFFEVLNRDTNQGDIGLASSLNAGKWIYHQIVLDEPFHLSYPFVFAWEGKVYLVPETVAAGSVRVYESTQFPSRWKLKQELIPDVALADPTLFEHEGTWWMFGGKSGTHDELRLFYADTPFSKWQEHPQSPLIQGDANRARPGGRVVMVNGQLWRVTQDCDPRYGNALRAYPIVKLSRTEYAEDPTNMKTLLEGTGQDWNAAGMHHADLWRMESGGWRACVDGHQKVWLRP